MTNCILFSPLKKAKQKKYNNMKISIYKTEKTLWQKIYSFFGFWRYKESFAKNGESTRYRMVFYWTMLPRFLQKSNKGFFRFHRKIDVFSVNITEKEYNK